VPEDKNVVREAVLARIRQSNEFPTMSSTVSLLSKFNPNDDVSITEFANVILKDLALTTKILKLVNSVHFMQFGEVTTISRAIILLGFENVKNLAVTLMLFDQLQKHKSNEPLMEGIVKSFYSAILSRRITEEIGFVLQEEAFLCSLFHLFGKLLVSLVMPEKVHDIEKFMAHHNVSDTVASLSVLGISYEDVGIDIAREWNFPKKIISSMRRIMPSEITDYPSETDRLRTISTFTHNVANIISSSESIKDRELLIGKLIKNFGPQLKTLEGTINRLVGDTAKEFVEFSNVFNLNLRSSRFSNNLLGLTDKEAPRHQKKEETIPSIPTSIETFDDLIKLDDHETPESIFSRGIQDINKSLLSGYSLNDIVKIVLETMYRGLQLSEHARVLFIVRDTKRPVMTVRYGFGDAIQDTKEWFEIVLNGSNDVFNISINNQKDFIIKNISAPDINSMFPEWYKKRTLADVFIILLPIVVNNVTIGLYFIQGSSEEIGKLTSVHFNNLKILRDQTVMAIKQKRGF